MPTKIRSGARIKTNHLNTTILTFKKIGNLFDHLFKR